MTTWGRWRTRKAKSASLPIGSLPTGCTRQPFQSWSSRVCQPRIETWWPHSARPLQTKRVTFPKPEGVSGLSEIQSTRISARAPRRMPQQRSPCPSRPGSTLSLLVGRRYGVPDGLSSRVRQQRGGARQGSPAASSVRVNRASLRPRAAAWTFMLSPVPFRVRRSSWTRPSGKEEAMKYMLLIHQGNTPVPGTPAWEALSEDERKAIPTAYQAINQTEGVTPGEWMESPETATTVRVENGEALTPDGPFVAVKEALGGCLFFEGAKP